MLFNNIDEYIAGREQLIAAVEKFARDRDALNRWLEQSEKEFLVACEAREAKRNAAREAKRNAAREAKRNAVKNELGKLSEHHEA